MTGAAPIRTTCPYCGVGCGVLATPDGRGGVSIKGDPHHPANFGRLCSKGSALGQTVDLEGRLLSPRVNGLDAGWDEALDHVAAKLSEAIDTHGPDSVAIYGSGQLLTEDYYVANKLMKGFIGTANIDTNSRLCMASSVAGHKRAFGADTVPGTYEDLEQADLLVLVGTNLAWCHPVLFQRITAAREANPDLRVVVVDPRRTATCDIADLHLSIAPDADTALFNGLLTAIAQSDALDQAYLDAHVTGLREALEAARPWTVARVAAACNLPAADVAAFYQLFVSTAKTVTVYSQGVNQSTSGTDKVNAIINCHLATGRIGKPGTGPFSVTGQPNAMGGREVGGLANMLAAHLELEEPDHRSAVRAFWNSPAIAERPGLKAVDLFRACGDGRIRFLWILSTNPAVSMPQADDVARMIATCDTLVVSEMNADTDTARLADVLLPATGWGEKSGTVTNSERRISRQRAFLPAPGEARPDWWALKEVACRMGWADAFSYGSPAEIFREHAQLSEIAATLGRDFDIGKLAGLSDAEYGRMLPRQWPVGGPARHFADGGFFTPDGRANMVAVTPPVRSDVAPGLHLNTGRVRDHWHTMTRTGKSPRLSRHFAEPFLEIHPADAAERGLAPADLAEVTSEHGTCVLRTLVTDRAAPGQVFAPMHWTAQYASQGRIDAVIASATDPVSGQPALKAGRVTVRRYGAAWHGYAVSRTRPEPGGITGYWALARISEGWQVELAGRNDPNDWAETARALFAAPDAEPITFSDPVRRRHRLALMQGDQVVAALFVSPEPVEIARTHVAETFSTATATQVLAGRRGAAQADPGPTVCVCLNVGANAILDAIASGTATSLDAIGRYLGAGSNCGSCRPEINALIARSAGRVAAE